MKKFVTLWLLSLIFVSLWVGGKAHAFDTGTKYNSANMAYPPGSTIGQYIVLDNTMRNAASITFTVDSHGGGGRPNEHDTGNIRLTFYSSAGAQLYTQQTNYNLNLTQMNAWSTGPGDNSAPWVTLSMTVNNCGNGCSNVAYVKVEMIGTDGSWWAGNYGPQWRLPTLTIAGDNTNRIYNPEFGSYNGTIAQGWSSSSNWGACGTTSGSTMCTTTAPGVTANISGSGYSATGGTPSGSPGGYTGTLTTADANPGTGGGSSGGAQNTLCCGGGAAPFAADSTNVNRVNNFVSRTTNDSQVYITQLGNNNTITVDQQGTKQNYTYINNQGSNNDFSITQKGNANTQVNYSYTTVNGNSNSVNVNQNSTGGGKGAFINIQNNNNNVTLSQTDSGSHYAEVGLSGGNKTVSIQQSGSAAQMASVQLSGNPTSLTLQQAGSTQNFYSIQFNCATAGGCAPISVTQGK